MTKNQKDSEAGEGGDDQTQGMTAEHLITYNDQQRVQALTAAITDACDDHFRFEIVIALSTMLGRLLVAADDELAEETLSRFCDRVRLVRQAAATTNDDFRHQRPV